MYRFPYMVASTQAIASALASHNGFGSATNIGWTVNAGFRQLVAPVPMSFENMHVKLDTAPGAGTSQLFYSRKNESIDNIALTIADTATVGSDTTNITNVVAGDRVDIHHSWSGVVADPTGAAWSIFSRCNAQVLNANDGATVTGTRYVGLQATSASSTTEATVAQAFPTSGVIKNLVAYLGSGTLTSGNYVVTLYKNGSPTALTVTLDSSNRIAYDTSHEISVVEGDLLSWEQARNTPSSNRTIEISCQFVASKPGEGVLLTTTGATAVTHGTKAYSGFYACSNQFGTITNRQAYALPLTFTKLYVQLGTAPGSGFSRTIALDNNGSDALAVTIADTATSGSATGTAVTKLGDPISISSIRNHASTANSTLKIGLVFQAQNLSSFVGL